MRLLRGVDFDVLRGGLFARAGLERVGVTTVARTLSTPLEAGAGAVAVNGSDAAAGSMRKCGSSSAPLVSSRL
ncbi:hypothetical protein [Streptomyces erythrochromogenes]|uniref:hypothetical protein n=1 Tax=Streptomyces erythrochromogenes TaxID=285574 RepID=UPI00367C91CC